MAPVFQMEQYFQESLHKKADFMSFDFKFHFHFLEFPAFPVPVNEVVSIIVLGNISVTHLRLDPFSVSVHQNHIIISF